MRSSVPATLSLLTIASAQLYGPPDSGHSSASRSGSSAATNTSSGSGPIHTVQVGQSGFTFTPNSLTAAVGDQVEFHFANPPHSVTQASFDKPCVPSSDTAFFSGFVTDTSQVFTLTINDTNPVWFYCAVPLHCQSGMVGVINQPASGPNTLDAFTKAASSVANSVAPAGVQGGVLGAAGSAPSSSSETASGSAPSGTETGSAPSTQTSNNSAAGLMEVGGYRTVVAAGIVACLAGLAGTLLV